MSRGSVRSIASACCRNAVSSGPRTAFSAAPDASARRIRSSARRLASASVRVASRVRQSHLYEARSSGLASVVCRPGRTLCVGGEVDWQRRTRRQPTDVHAARRTRARWQRHAGLQACLDIQSFGKFVRPQQLQQPEEAVRVVFERRCAEQQEMTSERGDRRDGTIRRLAGMTGGRRSRCASSMTSRSMPALTACAPRSGRLTSVSSASTARRWTSKGLKPAPKSRATSARRGGSSSVNTWWYLRHNSPSHCTVSASGTMTRQRSMFCGVEQPIHDQRRLDRLAQPDLVGQQPAHRHPCRRAFGDVQLVREQPHAAAEKRAEAAGFTRRQEAQDVEPRQDVRGVVDLACGQPFEQRTVAARCPVGSRLRRPEPAHRCVAASRSVVPSCGKWTTSTRPSMAVTRPVPSSALKRWVRWSPTDQEGTGGFYRGRMVDGAEGEEHRPWSHGNPHARVGGISPADARSCGCVGGNLRSPQRLCPGEQRRAKGTAPARPPLSQGKRHANGAGHNCARDARFPVLMTPADDTSREDQWSIYTAHRFRPPGDVWLDVFSAANSRGLLASGGRWSGYGGAQPTTRQGRFGGESGIRTHGRVSPTHAFQACAFSLSAISPSLESTPCERSASDYPTRQRSFLAPTRSRLDSAS